MAEAPSILLGFVFLGERLHAVQWVAVALAAAGVANQILAVGELPWIALVLAGSFSLYGLLRKTLAVSALPGLFVEASVLAPVALLYMVLPSSSVGEESLSPNHPDTSSRF